jgi:malate dehydrogenase
MAKISIIGAGNVGSLAAMYIAQENLADIVLIDAIKGLAKARALDISDALAIAGNKRKIFATSDYNEIRNSNIVIITAGLPRRSGMSRDDLLLKNTKIVLEIMENVKRFAPYSIIIMVTNPLDVMSYLAYKVSGFLANKVMGMAGVLDGGRFSNFISQELTIDVSRIMTKVLGSHGDSMVPLVQYSTISGRPLTELLSQERIDRLIAKTKKRGTEIVSLLGRGSASFGPSQAILSMVKAIIRDSKEEMCVSAYLNGQYGIEGIFIGVPAKIGKEGIEEIIELALNEEEKEALNNSAKIIKDSLIKIKNQIPKI